MVLWACRTRLVIEVVSIATEKYFIVRGTQILMYASTSEH